MNLDVNLLRRRPDGPRVLIALDQSTLSDLALDEARAATRDLLLRGAEAGKLVCPMSPGANDETIGAPKLWRAISDLHQELSMGVDVRDPKDIRQREAFAAAARFCGTEPLYALADEAFDRDPHTERDELYAGGFRVIARIGPNDPQRTEVAREKAKEPGLQVAYDGARALKRSFSEQADGEYEAMVKWVLGPLADPGFAAEFEQKQAAAADAMLRDDFDGLGKYFALARRLEFAKALLERFPGLAGQEAEFARSADLACMPALRYPALLRAGLAISPRRRAKPGDGYDIDHLTWGLSRCDLVTADASMTQLLRNHKLVPVGCRIFNGREMRAFHDAVERAVEGP